VDGGTSDTFSGEESAQAAHRQRGIRGTMPERERVALRVHHEIGALGVAQFIANLRHREIRIRLSPDATLERHNLEAAAGKLFGNDSAGQAKTNEDDVHFFKLCGHGKPPECSYSRSAMLTGGTT